MAATVLEITLGLTPIRLNLLMPTLDYTSRHTQQSLLTLLHAGKASFCEAFERQNLIPQQPKDLVAAFISSPQTHPLALPSALVFKNINDQTPKEFTNDWWREIVEPAIHDPKLCGTGEVLYIAKKAGIPDFWLSSGEDYTLTDTIPDCEYELVLIDSLSQQHCHADAIHQSYAKLQEISTFTANPEFDDAFFCLQKPID